MDKILVENIGMKFEVRDANVLLVDEIERAVVGV